MAKLSDATLGDDPIAGEFIPYKPISPSAVLALVLGGSAVVAAMTTPDVGWSFLAVPAVALAVAARSFGSIRRYDMKGRNASRAGVVLSVLAIVGGTAAYLHYLKTAVPPGYQEISYEPLQPRGPEQIPTTAQELTGKKVFLRGYVFPDPNNRTRGIKSFVLCRDNSTCCFGGQPKLTDMVEVTLKDPLRLDYTSSLRGVGGTLRIASEKTGPVGNVVYHLDDVEVLQ